MDEKHLRFDFSHYEQVSREELQQVEAMVNEKIQENIPRGEEREVPIEEARERGAMMLFGEQYGDRVRVISFDPDYSVELCGGTHVEATGEIGYLRLADESSAAAGIRRIEAMAGRSADRLLRGERELLEGIRGELGQTEDPVRDVRRLAEERKELQKEVERLRLQQATTRLDRLMAESEQLREDLRLTRGEIEGADMDLLKQLGYEALEKRPEGAVTILGSRDPEEDKVYLVAAVTEDLAGAGLKAGALVGELGRRLGGGGGGQPTLATAGGRHPEKLPGLLEEAGRLILEQLDS